jgi:hypothetical protein
MHHTLSCCRLTYTAHPILSSTDAIIGWVSTDMVWAIHCVASHSHILPQPLAAYLVLSSLLHLHPWVLSLSSSRVPIIRYSCLLFLPSAHGLLLTLTSTGQDSHLTTHLLIHSSTHPLIHSSSVMPPVPMASQVCSSPLVCLSVQR